MQPKNSASYYIHRMLKLWLTTSPDDFAGEYDDIEEMFKRGLTRLILDKQLRYGSEKRTARVEDYDRWLLSLPMEYRDRIWVRGTPDMAEQLDVRGCVLEASFLAGEVRESWKRVNTIVLCRNLDEVAALPQWVSGALLGPVFQPLSALEPVKTLGEDILGDISKAEPSGIPLILWGGLDQECIEEISGKFDLKSRISGIACLGGIWNYADSVNAFIKLQRSFLTKSI
ncbi:MAG: hypothetical protein MJZ26_14375 [Fibrobacter sp.]|nr:hypothetical protein [Fibrobacter sp.]